MNKSYININNLSYIYPSDIKAIDNISLDIAKGESITLLGQNGAGKTTLAKLLNGLILPTSGYILIDRNNTRDSKINFANLVGYVFQNPDDQISERKVSKEINFNSLKQSNKKSIDINHIIDILDLKGDLNTHPWSLSRAKRKLITIVSIISYGPDILIFDEPTLGQDKIDIDRLVQVYDYLKSTNKTIITISHDIDFCVKVSTSAIALVEGKIMYNGNFSDLIVNKSILNSLGLEQPRLCRLASMLGFNKPIIIQEDFISAIRQRKTRG